MLHPVYDVHQKGSEASGQVRELQRDVRHAERRLPRQEPPEDLQVPEIPPVVTKRKERM